MGGTQPEMEIAVGLPSSATGQPGDGRNSSRSFSVEAGPRRTCRPLPRSDSADGARGPAQAVPEAAYQETAGLGYCRKVSDTTTDKRRSSTLVLFAELGTRGAASAASYSAASASVTSHPFTSMGPQTLSSAQAATVASPSPSIGLLCRCGHRGPIVMCQLGRHSLLLIVQVDEKLLATQ